MRDQSHPATRSALFNVPGPVRSLAGFLRWYVREITGSAAYDRYVERVRRRQETRPGEPPLSRREYERRRADHHQETPGSRCC